MRSSEALRDVENVGLRASHRPISHPASAPGRTDAMLRLRLDHMREVQQIWGRDTRESAIRQVAGIMRNSLRSGDGGDDAAGGNDIVNEIRGDGFTILLRGAAEADAATIARRLGRALGRSRIDGLANNLRLSASFGVAGRRAGESFPLWRARAQAALNCATARGDDQIVEARWAEEVRLLPPPSAAEASSRTA